MGDMKPVFEVVESPGGLYIGARRNAENGNYYWRITQYVMPAFTMIPPRADHPVHGHFWVPIDDENCWAWSFDYKVTRPLSAKERKAMEDGQGIHVAYVPGTFLPAPTRTTTTWSTARPEDRQDLQRCLRHRDAGRLAAGEHGADRRSH